VDELAHPTPIQPFWLTVSAHANIVIIWQRIERATMVIALGLRRDRFALHTIIPVAPLLFVQTQSAIQSAKGTEDCTYAGNVVPTQTLIHQVDWESGNVILADTITLRRQPSTST
jgi:hypothetical protein